jgi:hypothetical protein
VAGSPNARDAQAALVRELERVQRLHEERTRNPILTGALDRLAAWQARRLRRTYADLEAQPRYAAAIDFFENDLYGPGDFSRRDSDLARIVPLLVHMMPAGVVTTVARAMELNALSQELDRVVLSRLRSATGTFTVEEYCKAYRRAGNFPLRLRQIQLIGEVGAALDHYVHKPFIRSALPMMRGPARLWGLSALQDFLERGFASFGRMDGAQEFLATIKARETRIHDAIVAREPRPFPDPFAPQISSPEAAV